MLPPPPPRHPSSHQRVVSNTSPIPLTSPPHVDRAIPGAVHSPERRSVPNYDTGLPAAASLADGNSRISPANSTAFAASCPPPDPAVRSPPATPPSITSPPPKHPSVEAAPAALLQARLEELEDLEVAEMLDRVGDRLKELKVAGPAVPVDYPEKEAFRDERGKLDRVGYLIAYFTSLVVDYTPPSLVGSAPREDFSFREVREDLQRFYVICPPSVWQRVLTGDLAKIWRWEDPKRTAKWAALYFVLWLFDLIPFYPIAVFLALILRTRLFPPSTNEVLAASTERAARTREAAELSKQLKNTSGRVGFALEGAHSLLSDLREHIPLRRSADEEKTLASAVGASALLGGMAAAASLDGETLRKRKGKELDESSALVRAIGASAAVAGGVAAPQRTTIETLKPEVPLDVNDSSYDHHSPATNQSGDVSIYRLVRNLSKSFGPPVQTLLDDAADLLEMSRNLIQHPDHPSVTPVLCRLSFICLTLLITPTWIQIKSFWLYLAFEFFVLWHLRELYPGWRRALLPYWWVMAGAPTDAEYALYVLQKRGAENRPIKGSKTIKRLARDRAKSIGSSSPITRLGEAGSLLTHNKSSSSDAATIASGPPVNDPTSSSFFALHRAMPGQLFVSSTSIRFVPSRRLQKVGIQKLARRLARSPESDSLPDVASVQSVSAVETDAGMEIEIGDVEKVKKEQRFALAGLQITGKDGQVWRFTNVARRDDAFNKILSFSAALWKET
ncbi:hypothetical protein JCM21900_000382 [Sporobolomyces salmonicolor]